MIISEEFAEAIEEIKRADHSIFATLKYTRSCDVVVNVLERFNKTFASAIHAALLHAKEKKAIDDIPPDSKNREKLFRQLFPDLKEHMDNHALIRKVLSFREYKCEDEFRKNLTLITQVEGQEVRINVEQIEHFYFEIKKFMDALRKVFSGEQE